MALIPESTHSRSGCSLLSSRARRRTSSSSSRVRPPVETQYSWTGATPRPRARVTKYRSLLEAGTDPALVAGWIAEVQGERLRAEAELASLRPTAPPTAAEVRDLVDGLGGLTAVLAHADPESKARVYSELGLRLTYDHVRNLVVAEVQPWATARVGGGT